MAVVVSRLQEGSVNLILHVQMGGDGIAELTDFPLIGPTEFAPPMPAGPTIRVMQIWYSMVWFDVVLKFNSPAPRPFWTLSRDTTDYIDFRCFGGLADPGIDPPADRDGKLLISTNNFAPLGSSGSIVFDIRKR